MEKTTLYLPPDLAVALREASRRSGRPQAEILREALRAHLASVRPGPLRSLGAGEDDEVTAAQAESWLEERLGQ